MVLRQNRRPYGAVLLFMALFKYLFVFDGVW